MRTPERILGTRLWYRHALLVSNTASLNEFVDKFQSFASPATGLGLSRRLMSEWGAGRRYVSDGIVRRVDSLVPGSEIVLVIAKLLTQKHLSAPGVRRMVKDLFVTDPNGVRSWRLPRISKPATDDSDICRYAWFDSTSLARRGDFFGFLSLLALLRESVAMSDCSGTRRYVKEIYTMLPSVAALDWVLPDIDLLLQCMEDMQRGFRWYHAAVFIDWGVFRERMCHVPSGEDGTAFVSSVFAGSSAAAAYGTTPRPVPLLDKVVPLWTYVRCHQPKPAAPQSQFGNKRNRRLGGPKRFAE